MTLKDVFDENNIEIYKRSKGNHLRAIAQQTGVDLKDMIFFDNQYGNCQDVAKVGVTSVYTPQGVTRKAFDDGLASFPSPGQIIGPKRQEFPFSVWTTPSHLNVRFHGNWRKDSLLTAGR